MNVKESELFKCDIFNAGQHLRRLISFDGDQLSCTRSVRTGMFGSLDKDASVSDVISRVSSHTTISHTRDPVPIGKSSGVKRRLLLADWASRSGSQFDGADYFFGTEFNVLRRY